MKKIVGWILIANPVVVFVTAILIYNIITAGAGYWFWANPVQSFTWCGVAFIAWFSFVSLATYVAERNGWSLGIFYKPGDTNALAMVPLTGIVFAFVVGARGNTLHIIDAQAHTYLTYLLFAVVLCALHMGVRLDMNRRRRERARITSRP